jgi:hypothetical protein
MARVVQRRTPPYLLIVFVILFVFATVMAVLFFNKFNTAEEQVMQFRQTQDLLISANDLKSRPEITDMIHQYENAKKAPGTIPQRVTEQLRGQITLLAADITGSPNSTFEEARQRIAQTSQALGVPNVNERGLLALLTDFRSLLGVKETEMGKLKTDADQLRAKVTEAERQQAADKTAFEEKVKEKESQIAALDTKFTALSQQTDTRLDDTKKTYDQTVEELRKQTKVVADDLTTRTRERDLWEQKYRELLTKVAHGEVDTEKVAYRPDGKVVSLVPAEGMAYLNIGSKDRVSEGLQFSVYPYTGIPQSGTGKGVLEVTNVSPNVCEARIIQQSKDSPIIPGDLVANLVFDALRDYKLLVEGTFDLNNTGEASPAGNKAIKELIRRYGGTIVKDLSIETDFVVLGEAPPRLKKPEDTDTQEAWDLYQERLKDFNRYQQIKDSAAGMKVPVISSRRFLDLIGYVPTKGKAD